MSDQLLSIVGVGKEEGRPIENPATGDVIGYAPDHTADDLDAAVGGAVEKQPEWARLGHSARSNYLNKMADAIDAHAEELAQLLTLESGKPLNGPNSRMEVSMCGDWLRANAEFETPSEVLVDDGEARAVLEYEPIGVVGAISPWNWPMMITIWQIAPALRMGNTVVVKPSENTPLSVLALVHVLNTVLPEGVLHAISGGREVGHG